MEKDNIFPTDNPDLTLGGLLPKISPLGRFLYILAMCATMVLSVICVLLFL